MKLHLCIFSTFLVCCLSDVMTKYARLQEGSDVTALDMLNCQLRANGNTSCAIRFGNTVTQSVWTENERCEQLSVDWCKTVIMEPEYTYFGKSVVVYTPPFNYISYPLPTFEIWEEIPIAIKAGSSMTIKFTPSAEEWLKIMINFINAGGSSVYKKPFGMGNPILPGIESAITAMFNATQFTLYVEGHEYNSGDIGTVTDIRILKFAFYDWPGVIHHLSYRAAP